MQSAEENEEIPKVVTDNAAEKNEENPSNKDITGTIVENNASTNTDVLDEEVKILDKLFSNRYTESDIEYMSTLNSSLAPPPCVSDWYSRPRRTYDWTRNQATGGDRQNNQRFGNNDRPRDYQNDRHYSSHYQSDDRRKWESNDGRHGQYDSQKGHQYNRQGYQNDFQRGHHYDRQGYQNDFQRGHHYDRQNYQPDKKPRYDNTYNEHDRSGDHRRQSNDRHSNNDESRGPSRNLYAGMKKPEHND